MEKRYSIWALFCSPTFQVSQVQGGVVQGSPDEFGIAVAADHVHVDDFPAAVLRLYASTTNISPSAATDAMIA